MASHAHTGMMAEDAVASAVIEDAGCIGAALATARGCAGMMTIPPVSRHCRCCCKVISGLAGPDSARTLWAGCLAGGQPNDPVGYQRMGDSDEAACERRVYRSGSKGNSMDDNYTDNDDNNNICSAALVPDGAAISRSKEAPTKWRWHVVFFAIANESVVDLTCALRENPALVNCPRENGGESPLILAVQKASVELTLMLLAAGADVNLPNTDGSTALMFAAAERCACFTHLLLRCGAQVNAKSKDGWTALMYATETGNNEAARCLIAAGAEIDDSDWTGRTSIMFAAMEGKSDTIRLLCALGASIDHKNVFGMTALMYAVMHSHATAVRTLAELGANLDHTTLESQDTAGHMALDVEISLILLAAGSNFSLKDNRGRSVWDLITDVLPKPLGALEAACILREKGMFV
jgi:ankyrin repeat protein